MTQGEREYFVGEEHFQKLLPAVEEKPMWSNYNSRWYCQEEPRLFCPRTPGVEVTRWTSPHNWTGDRASFWVGSEAGEAKYVNGGDSSAHKRRLIWVVNLPFGLVVEEAAVIGFKVRVSITSTYRHGPSGPRGQPLSRTAKACAVTFIDSYHAIRGEESRTKKALDDLWTFGNDKCASVTRIRKKTVLAKMVCLG